MSLSTSSLPFDPSLYPVIERKLEREIERRREKLQQESRLIEFVEAAWPAIDAAEYQSCWAIDALCDHLEGVALGHIPRLLVNYPPRCAKTSVASICYPAWTWARRQRTFWSSASVRFLCGSYNNELSLQNSNKTRRLIQSAWYQNRWGKTFTLRDDQNTKSQFDNTAGGSRIATSVGGSLIGIGGDIILVDDPHNTVAVESEPERKTVLTWWSELRSTRLNDPKQSAIVVIMQRLHEEDVSGVIASGDDYPEWTHLMLPMRHDVGRHCVTVLKWDEQGEPEQEWNDPRVAPGELMWPERFGEKEVAALERDLGPYMAAGRLQQSPMPPGGGIFKREWWQLWEGRDGKFPQFDYIVASLDSAFTEKEENDPSGFTVWGIWTDPDANLQWDDREGKFWKKASGRSQPKVMLVHAWRKHLQMHGPEVVREPNESELAYIRRAQPSWGLVEWVAYTCRRFKVDRLLIEAKASGITAAQEIQRLYANDGWITQLEQVSGDKVARAHAVVPAWSQGLVFAPDREWADLVIEEMSVFPKGRYKDLTDSATQAVRHLRAMGLIQNADEIAHDDRERMRLKKPMEPLYPS